MTKSTGVGRGKGGGGRKPGAGRPRKPRPHEIEQAAKAVKEEAAALPPQIVKAAAALPPDDDEAAPETFRDLLPLARKTLRQVMKYGSDAAKVAAAKEACLRSDAEAEAAGAHGKKAKQQERVNELSAPGSRFAVRNQGPGLAN